ncbi:hypothetical protein L1887_63520 [Cichorium endivia]|nr:hypothetical protein L1887_63520 [Cichorium endivia]
MGCPQAGAGEHAGISPRRRVLPTSIDATASPRAYRQLGLWPPHQSAPVHAPSRSADRLSPFHIRPGRIAGPHSLPSRQFQALFDSLFKVLFIFPSRGTCLLSVSHRQRLVVRQGSGHDGALTLSGAPSRGLGPGPPLRTLLQTTIRTARPSDFQAGLIRFRSPLLRESLYMFTGSFCFAGFDNDPSAGSPTETLLRLLLPLNDKVQWNSRDVAGGRNRPRRRDPNTSPDHSIGRSDGRVCTKGRDVVNAS